jgi:hypothetical protein
VSATTDEQIVTSFAPTSSGIFPSVLTGFSRASGNDGLHRSRPQRERVEVPATDDEPTGDLVGVEVTEVVGLEVRLGVAGEHPSVFWGD